MKTLISISTLLLASLAATHANDVLVYQGTRHGGSQGNGLTATNSRGRAILVIDTKTGEIGYFSKDKYGARFKEFGKVSIILFPVGKSQNGTPVFDKAFISATKETTGKERHLSVRLQGRSDLTYIGYAAENPRWPSKLEGSMFQLIEGKPALLGGTVPFPVIDPNPFQSRVDLNVKYDAVLSEYAVGPNPKTATFGSVVRYIAKRMQDQGLNVTGVDEPIGNLNSGTINLGP
jgi:hypothetical protein